MQAQAGNGVMKGVAEVRDTDGNLVRTLEFSNTVTPKQFEEAKKALVGGLENVSDTHDSDS
jgi:hypothetical protein